jgi:hypothetical protein
MRMLSISTRMLAGQAWEAPVPARNRMLLAPVVTVALSFLVA